MPPFLVWCQTVVATQGTAPSARNPPAGHWSQRLLSCSSAPGNPRSCKGLVNSIICWYEIHNIWRNNWPVPWKIPGNLLCVGYYSRPQRRPRSEWNQRRGSWFIDWKAVRNLRPKWHGFEGFQFTPHCCNVTGNNVASLDIEIPPNSSFTFQWIFAKLHPSGPIRGPEIVVPIVSIFFLGVQMISATILSLFQEIHRNASWRRNILNLCVFLNFWPPKKATEVYTPSCYWKAVSKHWCPLWTSPPATGRLGMPRRKQVTWIVYQPAPFSGPYQTKAEGV